MTHERVGQSSKPVADTDQAELRALLRAVGIKRHGASWKKPMADDLGCDKSTVTLWDQGKRKIRSMPAKTLRRMARASGIGKDDIIAHLSVDTAN